MDYGVTKDGFIKKRYDTIYEEIQADVEEATGIDISVNPKSYINVLLSSIADKIAAVWEVAEATYYSMFPSTSEGMNLDYACEFAGVTRSEGTATKYYILCTGDDGAAIPEGTRISSDTKPTYYFTVSSEQVISRSAFNKAKIKIAGSLTYTKSYTVTIESQEFTCVFDSTIDSAYNSIKDNLDYEESIDFTVANGDNDEEYTGSLDGADIARTILYSLAKDINDAVTGFTASLEEIKEDSSNENDKKTYPVLSIESNLKYVNYSYELCDYLTSDSVSSIIIFESEDLDDVVLPAGAICNIETSLVTNNDGFQSCTNLASPIHGKARESDEELRQSYLSKQAYRACTTIESIKAAILNNVDNVLSVAGFENDTDYNKDFSGQSIPCHTIAFVVDGGEEASIAEVILKYKPAGIGTFAVNDASIAHIVEVPTGYNSSITIRYSNPIPINVHLDVIIESNPEEAMPSNYATYTKDAIKEYTDSITSGQNVIIQKAITNINKVVSGIAYIEITASWTQDGEEYTSKKYITMDEWHKAYFEKDDGTLDITVYKYDGATLEKEGSKYKVTSEDSNGNKVSVYYHSNGTKMWESGTYYDSSGNSIKAVSSVSTASIALASTASKFEGDYYDSNNVKVVDYNGNYYDSDGTVLIDASNVYTIDTGIYSIKRNSSDGADYYNGNNPILDAKGNYYDSNGKTILDAEGNYYDSSGNKILDAEGRYYYKTNTDGNQTVLYDNGNYYDSNGKIILDSDGNYYDSNNSKVLDSAGNYYCADGSSINITSWLVSSPEDDYTADGVTIITVDGVVNDRDGNLIKDKDGNFYGRNQELIKNGGGDYYNGGNSPIIDSKGIVYNEDGVEIKDNDGWYYYNELLIKDSDGNMYGRDGDTMIWSSEGYYCYGEGNKVADTEGNYYLSSSSDDIWKYIRIKDSDGNFYHRDTGNLIKDSDGNFYDGESLIIDTDGNYYDDYGDIIKFTTEG